MTIKIEESKNPYTRDFGTTPSTYIERTVLQDDIARSFINGVTDDKVYFIVGQRGFGKSSLLRAAKNKIEQAKNWIVIELRANNDNLIHELAAELYADHLLNEKLIELGIDFSLLNIGLAIHSKNKTVISSDEVALKSMFQTAETLGKKILVCIDEISDTKSIRDFCALFNVCKGESYPFYLLMDGLYKNTTALENVPDLTFLKRVQKLEVSTLGKMEMVYSYKQYLHIEDDALALKLANITKGYPYAFQLVGFYTWLWIKENPNLFDDYSSYELRLNEQLDNNLNNYVYSTLWSEISKTEQDILSIMAYFKLTKVKDIREKYSSVFPNRAEMTSSNFSKYREKLIKMSILRSNSNTILEFNLPRFDVFALINGSEELN